LRSEQLESEKTSAVRSRKPRLVFNQPSALGADAPVGILTASTTARRVVTVTALAAADLGIKQCT
jgi:hypothetical protein